MILRLLKYRLLKITELDFCSENFNSLDFRDLNFVVVKFNRLKFKTIKFSSLENIPLNFRPVKIGTLQDRRTKLRGAGLRVVYLLSADNESGPVPSTRFGPISRFEAHSSG
jgi:hypothetical protein